MRRLRYAVIWFLDWIVDVRILRHRCPAFCHWLALHPWWDAPAPPSRLEEPTP